jgi:hypothetical protein
VFVSRVARVLSFLLTVHCVVCVVLQTERSFLKQPKVFLR